MKRYLVLLLILFIELSRGMAVADVIPQYWADPDHEEITSEAIDLLIEKGKLSDRQREELERYREWIKDGSEAEDGYSENYRAPWRSDNHAFEPDSYDPVKKDGVESVVMHLPLIGQKEQKIQEVTRIQIMTKRMSMTGRMHEDTTKRVIKKRPISALAMYAIFFRMYLCQGIPFHQ
jgi:hypothetical protein